MKSEFTVKWLIVPLCAASLLAGTEKEKPKFDPGSVTDYSTRQTVDNVTIAASPFINDDETARAFGKLNPNKYEVLPVLVIVQNARGDAIALDRMKAELVTPDRQHIVATSAQDLRYVRGPDRPKVYTGPIPGAPPHVGKSKNPFNAWEIEGRAFAARVLPPKDVASGFFYFRAPYHAGSTIYITGLREASSGKELFYFEIPLEKQTVSERPKFIRPRQTSRGWREVQLPPVMRAR